MKKKPTQTDTTPIFPSSTMLGPAGNFAAAYSTYIETPTLFLFFSYLVTLGSIVSGFVRLKSEISPDTRLYTVLIGASADTRKSTSISKTVTFFREALQLPISFARSLRWAVCYGIGSAEGLCKLLKSNNRLLLVFDEFRSFVSKCKIDSSVLLPMVTTLYESNVYQNTTKTVDIELSDSHLSILSASTTDTFSRIFDNSFTSIGFNNRLLIIPGEGERKFSLPKKVPAELKESLQAELLEILAFVGDGIELDIIPSARAAWDKWYMTVEASVHVKRLDGMGLRLMMLLAVNEKKSVIDSSIVQRAIAILNWQLAVRKQYDPVDCDNVVASLEQRIIRSLSGPKSDRELRRAAHADRCGLWLFDAARKNLQKAGLISYNPTSRLWKLTDEGK